MGEIIQIKANEDGCIYIYNVGTKTWQKLSEIESTRELPKSVRNKIAAMQITISQGEQGD